jgi:hypothetical protein
MSMFDYIECQAPLPDGRRVDGFAFQSKTFREVADHFLNSLLKNGRG